MFESVDIYFSVVASVCGLTRLYPVVLSNFYGHIGFTRARRMNRMSLTTFIIFYRSNGASQHMQLLPDISANTRFLITPFS